MKIYSKQQLEKSIDQLRRKLKYYTTRLATSKISHDEFLEKIRPVTRSLNILEVMQKINFAKNDLTFLAEYYFMLYQVQCPEDYLIRSLNSSSTDKKIKNDIDDYEQFLSDIHKSIEDHHRSISKALREIKIDDLMQTTINDSNG